jgi:predicted RND superfamily exporter protein
VGRELPGGRERVSVRGRIAAGFERWGHLVVRHRWALIALMLALSAGLGAQLRHLEVDNSVEVFLHEDDPALLLYNEFRDQFGRDDVTVIAMKPPEIFDLVFLARLRALHADLEREVPYVDEVTSLVNARSTRGEGDELIVEDLLERWPENEGQLAVIRKRVLSNPLYVDGLISRDGRFTTVAVKPVTYSPTGEDAAALEGFEDTGAASSAPSVRRRFLTDHENAVMVKAIRGIMRRYEVSDTQMYLAGAPVVEERLEDEMQADMVQFMLVSTLTIVAVLYVVFRRMSGVLLPLLSVALSLTATLGTMVLLGIPLSLTTEILPTYLLTVGVCYSVHILVIFFQRLADGRSRQEAVRYALGHSGLAVAMTGLTTAGGLASFAWADVAPVSHLGVVGPLGVVFAMVFALVLLPALLAVVPLRGTAAVRQRRGTLPTRVVVACGRVCARHPWTVVGVSALTLALAAVGASRLRFANDYMLWFPAHEPLRSATELLDRELRGVVTLEAVVDSRDVNGLYAPELLDRIDRLALANRSVRHGDLFIGKTVSLTDVLKETHQALNENRAEFYAVPDNRQLVAQEMLLFENSGSDDLEELVDTQFSKARISMKVPWADWMLYPAFLDAMQRHAEEILGDGVRVRLTGFSALMARAAASFIVTMARSYVLALLIITPLMIFLLGRMGPGLLSMAPNLAPVLLTLGLMGWLDVPLDMSTMLIGGIIIGLAVDDTIHFMHRFNRYHEASGDPYQAVSDTLETTGTAMLFTSVVLAAGFLVYTLAYMANIAMFGLLSAFATLAAFLADVTLGPALMILVTRGGAHDPKPGTGSSGSSS